MTVRIIGEPASVRLAQAAPAALVGVACIGETVADDVLPGAERRFGGVRLFVNAENLGNVRQTKYAPLVRRVARSLPLEIPGLLEYEDAVGYGTCGLVEAVRRYDPSKGTNFHAYAVQRIRGSMIDAFRRSSARCAARRRPSRAPRCACRPRRGSGV